MRRARLPAYRGGTVVPPESKVSRIRARYHRAMDNPGIWIAVGVAALLVILAIIAVFVVVSARKGIAAQQARVDAAWSSIVEHAGARGTLLAELEGKVHGAGGHEREAVTESVTAREALAAAGDPATASAAEDGVQGAIRKLLKVAEGYPELQRDQSFLALQGELAREGGEIQTARRHFNGAVREYNTKVRTFPGSLVAGSMGAQPKEFFEVSDRAAIAAPPKVQF